MPGLNLVEQYEKDFLQVAKQMLMVFTQPYGAHKGRIECMIDRKVFGMKLGRRDLVLRTELPEG